MKQDLTHPGWLFPLLMLVNLYWCGASFAQDLRKSAAFSHPNDFRSIPTFGCARVDVRGDVEISVFLFEDPVEGVSSQGKVFRLVQRYSPERLEVFSTLHQRLSHAEVRRRLQEPSVVLLKSGDREIMDHWLHLFKPETLVIHAPPAAAAMEEVLDKHHLQSPEYGQNPPRFVYAVKADTASVTIRSLRTETSIETPIATEADSNSVKSDSREVSIVSHLDDLRYERTSLARIRRGTAGISVEDFSLSGRDQIPSPCLLFQSETKLGISDFYVSIINPNCLTLVTGLKKSPNDSADMPMKPIIRSKEERAAALAQVGNRLRRAKALIQRREYQLAMSEIAEIIEVVPNDPLPHYLQGYILHQSGKVTEAVAAVTRGVECERTQPLKDWYKQLEWLQGPARAWLEEQRQERRPR